MDENSLSIVNFSILRVLLSIKRFHLEFIFVLLPFRLSHATASPYLASILLPFSLQTTSRPRAPPRRSTNPTLSKTWAPPFAARTPSCSVCNHCYTPHTPATNSSSSNTRPALCPRSRPRPLRRPHCLREYCQQPPPPCRQRRHPAAGARGCWAARRKRPRAAALDWRISPSISRTTSASSNTTSFFSERTAY